MTPSGIPSGFKKILGIIYIAVAMILFGLSITWYLWPEQPLDQVAYKERVFDQCHQAGRDQRFRVIDNESSGYMTMHRNGLDNWRARILQAQLVINECSDGFEMSYFCMGSECRDTNDRSVNGIVMTFIYHEPE